MTCLAEQGVVKLACDSAKVSRALVYKAKTEDPVFAEAWDDAMDSAADVLEAEARRRAYEGVEEPIGFYKGAPSAHVRRYSDTLMIFLLKGARPEKFRERHEVTGKDGAPLMPDVVTIVNKAYGDGDGTTE
ncbi:MAG TPA: hypothetical protein VJS44_04685 [Pyrinomonadaceae bacterium]|nr:hypothetical protein [Pyrinomonadaceae bacterium]